MIVDYEYPRDQYIVRAVPVRLCTKCGLLKPRVDFMKPGYVYKTAWLKAYYRWCKQCRA